MLLCFEEQLYFSLLQYHAVEEWQSVRTVPGSPRLNLGSATYWLWGLSQVTSHPVAPFSHLHNENESLYLTGRGDD